MHTRIVLPLVLVLVLSGEAAAADSAVYRPDPAKVLGAENCAECHAPMVEAWKLTHHFETFNSMHRKPEARDISAKLGLRRIKDESLCLQCHYTVQSIDGKAKAISGISCESCHNAGADWNKIHSAKDDPDRLAKAEKLGMLRPANLYRVAANCFSCHTVPEEKLVNEAGHAAGGDFELVAWSQGEVRHNLQQSNGKKNEEASPERKRVLYVVGRLLDFEFGLRGLAQATREGPYAASMVKRIETAREKIAGIRQKIDLTDLGAILAAAEGVPLKSGNQERLVQAANRVAELSSRLAAGLDGAALSGLDPLLPAPTEYKGKAYSP